MGKYHEMWLELKQLLIERMDMKGKQDEWTYDHDKKLYKDLLAEMARFEVSIEFGVREESN